MLTITLRDLQWRARRFALGVAATALVFATTLLLAGTYMSFRSEGQRLVDAIGADAWLVTAGKGGPFTAMSPLPPEALVRVRGAPGVRSAEPLVTFRHIAVMGDHEKPLNILAAPPGGILRPRAVAGRAPRAPGEALADEAAGLPVGARISVRDVPLRIVGHTEGLTYFAGVATLVLGLEDGRRIAFDGQPLASAILTRGAPRAAPGGMKVMLPDDVVADVRSPTAGASSGLAVQAVLLTVVAAGILALMAYLTGLDRLTDFAVFKAIGASTGKLLAGLVLQILLLALVSAAAAAGLAALIAPLIPTGVELTAATYLALLGVAVAVGLLVSLISVRQATRVDPAIAFGGN